jgi:hypothetical protein
MVRDADNELRLGMPVMVQIDLDSSTSEGQLGSAPKG